MTTVQLNFTLRTSSKCKSVHLVGSWNGYQSQLPLGRDSSRDGGWKGTFRFKAPLMVPGARYWYYYIIDGSQVSHDPARTSVIEPTTGRKLNILDIPPAKHSSSRSGGGSTSSKSHSSRSSSLRASKKSAKGRSLSPSQIAHPLPSRPYETQLFRSEAFSSREMEALSRQYAAQRLADSSSDSESSSSSSSASSSNPPSSWTSSRSSNNSSPSSVSSLASPITPTGASSPGFAATYDLSPARGTGGIAGLLHACRCERYALMRDGRKFRVDCGGAVCGRSASPSSASASSSSDGYDSGGGEEEAAGRPRRGGQRRKSGGAGAKRGGGKKKGKTSGLRGMFSGRR